MTLCSGRFLARRETLALTAVIVTQNELELAEGQQELPRPDMSKVNLGVMDPIGGDDVLLTIKQRPKQTGGGLV